MRELDNDNLSKGRVLLIANNPTPTQKGMRLALKSLGWDLHVFCWEDYIHTSSERLQAKYVMGPLIRLMNNALIEKCMFLRPDVVIAWKGIYITRETLNCIKSYTRLVTSYHGDNPFGNYNIRFAKRYRIENNLILHKIVPYEKALFFHRQAAYFIRTIPLYDIHFVPRKTNLSEYKKAGAKEVHLLPFFYAPEYSFPIELNQNDQLKYGSDVVFIGHYEPDLRTECLESLIDANVNVRLFGRGWDRYLTKKVKGTFGSSIKPLYGDEYVKALCASKIALGFMSKLNKDTANSRCYEIPACRTLLLSERTDEITQIYKEDEEVVCFSDKEELVKKVEMLLNLPDKRKDIANAGHKRCLSSGYDVISRTRIWDDQVRKKLCDK